MSSCIQEKYSLLDSLQKYHKGRITFASTFNSCEAQRLIALFLCKVFKIRSGKIVMRWTCEFIFQLYSRLCDLNDYVILINWLTGHAHGATWPLLDTPPRACSRTRGPRLNHVVEWRMGRSGVAFGQFQSQHVLGQDEEAWPEAIANPAKRQAAWSLCLRDTTLSASGLDIYQTVKRWHRKFDPR